MDRWIQRVCWMLLWGVLYVCSLVPQPLKASPYSVVCLIHDFSWNVDQVAKSGTVTTSSPGNHRQTLNNSTNSITCMSLQVSDGQISSACQHKLHTFLCKMPQHHLVEFNFLMDPDRYSKFCLSFFFHSLTHSNRKRFKCSKEFSFIFTTSVVILMKIMSLVCNDLEPDREDSNAFLKEIY